MNEQNVQKINEISDYFKSRGFKCEREVKTIFNKSGNDILNNKTNKIDICCQKDKQIFCGEIEDSQYNQCIKNRRALQQARAGWEKEGYSVSTCQLGAEENFKEVCDIQETGLKKTSNATNTKKVEQKSVGIPKKKINLGGW